MSEQMVSAALESTLRHKDLAWGPPWNVAFPPSTDQVQSVVEAEQARREAFGQVALEQQD